MPVYISGGSASSISNLSLTNGYVYASSYLGTAGYLTVEGPAYVGTAGSSYGHLYVGNASYQGGYWHFGPYGVLESPWINISGDSGIVFSQDVLIQGNDSYTGTSATDLGVDGSIYAGGTCSATTFYATSDRRLKENIIDTELDYNSILDNLHIVDFNFKADEDKKVHVGVIAQELQEVLPEKYRAAIITEANSKLNKDDELPSFLTVEETKLVYVAILALKDQKQQIKDLTNRLEVLEKIVYEK